MVGGNFVLTEVRVSLVPPQSQARQARDMYVSSFQAKIAFSRFAEVQVFAAVQRGSARQSSTQSSTDFGGEANRAIDGKTTGELYQELSHAHGQLR